jgi:hypothetical protein
LLFTDFFKEKGYQTNNDCEIFFSYRIYGKEKNASMRLESFESNELIYFIIKSNLKDAGYVKNPKEIKKAYMDLTEFCKIFAAENKKSVLFLCGKLKGIINIDFNGFKDVDYNEESAANHLYGYPKEDALSYYEINPENIFRKHANIFKNITTFLKNYKENDPTFDYYLMYHRKQISFYLDGLETQMQISAENDSLVFEAPNRTFKINTTNEVENIFLSYFNEIKNAQRLENLYDPPRRNFVKYLKDKLNIIDLTITEQMHSNLLKIMDWKDIELKSIEQYKENHRIFFSNYRFTMVYAFEHYFYIDDSNHFVKFFSSEKSEEAENYYRQKVLDKTNESLDKNFSKIKKQKPV